MSKSKEHSKKAEKAKSTKPEFNFIFDKSNYMIMLIGLAVIVLGFVLMYGTEDIYDMRKTAIAPVVVLLGFGIEVYAILKKPQSSNESN